MRSQLTNLTVFVVVLAITPYANGFEPQAVAHAGDGQTSAQEVFTASMGDSFSASLADHGPLPNVTPSISLAGHSSATHATKGSGGKGSGGKGGCDCAECRGARFYGGIDYLQWYSKGRNVPPLVTTSPIGTLPADAGELNNPAANTSILFGGDDIGGDLEAAGRINFGLWLDDHQHTALAVRVYANEGDAETFAASSAGDPILARPYFDTNPLVNNEAAFLIAFPGTFSGSINMSSRTDVIGGDLFLRSLLYESGNRRVDWLAGYQMNRIDDDLVMWSTTTDAAVRADMLDVFDVKNEFHGGTLGFIAEAHQGCWTFSLLGKVAVGNMNQRAFIDGQYQLIGAGGRFGPGGLMAQPTNSGVYERDLTVWSPEAEIKVRYAVTDRLGLSVGYTAIYWDRVALAGDLVDRNLNSGQITNGGFPFAGPNDPQFTWRDTDYWMQAVSIGVDFTY